MAREDLNEAAPPKLNEAQMNLLARFVMRWMTNSLAVALGLGLASFGQAQPRTNALQQQQNGPIQQEIERLRMEAEQRARQNLDRDGKAALEETAKAATAIAANKTDKALRAIERALANLNAVAARNRAKTLLPVNADVEIIDAAPLDIEVIRQRAKGARDAIQERDYPGARVLLEGLRSEIRTRTSHVPITSYAGALQQAARLLDEKRTNDAKAVLLNALHSLVIIEQIRPLPVVLARAAIEKAETSQTTDRETAMRLLATAKYELERAKELGYAGKDPVYPSLSKSVSNLEKRLKGNENTVSAFSEVKEMLRRFLDRHSEATNAADVGRYPPIAGT